MTRSRALSGTARTLLKTMRIILADLTTYGILGTTTRKCFPPSLAADPSARGGAAHGGVPAERRWRIKGGDTAVTLFDGDRGFYSRFTGQAKRTGGNLTTYEY